MTELLPLAGLRICALPVESVTAFSFNESLRILKEEADADAERVRAEKTIADKLHALIGKVSDKKQRAALLELRRAVTQAKSPKSKDLDVAAAVDAQIAAEISEYQKSLDRISKLKERLKIAFEEELGGARAKIRGLLADPFILESIFLSSEKLYEAALRYVEQGSSEKAEAGKRDRQFERSFLEHLARCSTKTTPRGIVGAFGALECGGGGVVNGNWSGKLPITNRKTIISLPSARGLIDKLLRHGNLWRHVVPRVNPTTYRDGDKIFFWRNKDGMNRLKLLNLPSSEAVDKLIEIVFPRTLTGAQVISKFLADFPDYSEEDVTALYKKLGEFDVIKTELEIPTASQDPLRFILAWASRIPEKELPADLIGSMRELEKILKSLDALPAAAWPEREKLYLRAREIIVANTGSTAALQSLIVVDSGFQPDELRAGKEFLGEIGKLSEVTEMFSAGISSEVAEKHILEAIESRFTGGTRRRLLDTLDSTEVERSALQRDKSTLKRPTVDTAMTETASRLAAKAAVSGKETSLSTDDLRAICGTPAKDADEPEKGEAAFVVHAARGETGFVIVLENVIPMIPNRFVRWSHLFPENGPKSIAAMLKELCSRQATSEPRKTADVLFTQYQRVDATNWHPPLRPFDIETGMARSVAATDKILRLSELYLRPVVTSGGRTRLLLEHKAGDRFEEIIPRYDGIAFGEEMTSLYLWYAFRNNKKFWIPGLGLLAPDKDKWPFHLPRIRYGKIVICRETWCYRASDLTASFARSPDWFSNFRELNAWRLKAGIPQFCFWGRLGRTRLANSNFVDFGNPFLAENFLSELDKLKPEDDVVVQEMLPAPGEAAISNKNGSFAAEFVIGELRNE